MAKNNLAACLAVTLKFEGGYSNHPSDPGGATMRGVTQRVYDAYRQKHGQHRRHVKQITDGELQEIYRDDYWQPAGCEALEAGVDLSTFDASVNSGVSRGRKWLLASVGGTGKQTIQRMCRARLSFVQGLKTWRVFGKGWSRRIADIEARGVAMWAKASMPAGSTKSVLRNEAQEANREAANNGKQAGGVGGAGGAGGVVVATTDPNWLLLAGIGVLACLAVGALVVRRMQNKERAAAYAAVAAE